MNSRIRLTFALLLAACLPVSAWAQAPAAHLQVNTMVDCLERSHSLTEQTRAAFHAECELPPFYDADVLLACANSAGPYCQGLVGRMADPQGSLAFITSGSTRAIFLRKDMHEHLNRDPLAALLIIDAERDAISAQLALVIGCQLGRGTIQFLRDRPRADSPFDVTFHTRWSDEGKEEPDAVAKFVCSRDRAAR